MVTDKCVYCRAGIRSCSFGPGRMQCSSCGGKFDTPMDLYSAQRYAETASDGSHILQVYDDPTYGVSVVAVNGYGEYVYGRGSDSGWAAPTSLRSRLWPSTSPDLWFWTTRA